MKNLYRIIFWGVITLALIALGIVGVIESNKNFSSTKSELNYIVNTFNKSNIVDTYQKSGVIVEAEISKRNLVINYDGQTSKKYQFTFNNDSLEYTYLESDVFGLLLVKTVTNYINEYYGDSSHNIGKIFDDKDLLKTYTINDGITFISDGYTNNVKIKLGSIINIKTPAAVDDEEPVIDEEEITEEEVTE